MVSEPSPFSNSSSPYHTGGTSSSDMVNSTTSMNSESQSSCNTTSGSGSAATSTTGSSSNPECHAANNGSHHQSIVQRRLHRRHKLKLDIESAKQYRKFSLHFGAGPVGGQGPEVAVTSPTSSTTHHELSNLHCGGGATGGLRPIENQITNPNFVRYRKAVSVWQSLWAIAFGSDSFQRFLGILIRF